MAVEGASSTGSEGTGGAAAAGSADTGGTAASTGGAAQAGSAQGAGSAQAGDSAATGLNIAPPAYTPNFKFKVMDKEHEFDEWLRPAIKDADSEKKMRELYEKAYGLDHVKPKHQALQDQFKSVYGEHQGLTQELAQIGQAIKGNDLTTAFKSLGISDAAVFQYAYDRLQYDKLPNEQKARIDQDKEMRSRVYEQEQRLQQYEQMLEQQSVQTRTFELDSVLARPDIEVAASAFDARVGKPGAFKQEVVKRGALYWHTAQQDITAEQAVGEVMQLFGFQGNQQAAPQGQQAANGQQRPPVIPTVAGRGASPVKKAIKSLDELRALGNSM